jgi:manganese/zinc/iron transport system permease protein
MAIFDRDFSKTAGVPILSIDALLFILLVLAIVIGIRSVGVVLMAGMLIAPAVAARQFSDRLAGVLIYAALIGAASGFFGNYLSVELPAWGVRRGWGWDFSLPTGPMILLSASTFALFALLFARRNGLVSRLWRILGFKRKCREENLLKSLWRQSEDKEMSVDELRCWQNIGFIPCYWVLSRLKRQGWVEIHAGGRVRLTKDGRARAARIVRLHRLWEAYLVYLGQGVEKVHRSAEEMEHILTAELEKELTELLGHPKKDPHAQPIPNPEEML